MTGLLQWFAGKPNTVLLYIAVLFTLCAWLLVSSHMIQDISVDRRARACWSHAASPVAEVGECEEFIELTVTLPVAWLPFAVSPQALHPLSQSKPHANQLSVLSFICKGLFSVASPCIDNHCVSDQCQQLPCSPVSKPGCPCCMLADTTR